MYHTAVLNHWHSNHYNVPSPRKKNNLYYPLGIFYQCYALAHCTSQMYTTELPSLVFTEQSHWRLVPWNAMESLWGGGSVERCWHALQTRNELNMFETDTAQSTWVQLTNSPLPFKCRDKNWNHKLKKRLKIQHKLSIIIFFYIYILRIYNDAGAHL